MQDPTISRARIGIAASTFLAALTLSVAVPTSASASPITYALSRTIGAGSVSGTITTDGHLGTLVVADFVDWTLAVSDGVSATTMFGPLSGNNSVVLLFASTASPVSATVTDLLFDTNAPGNAGLGFFGAVNVFYCLYNISFGCGQFGGESVGAGNAFDQFIDTVPQVHRTGVFTFASAVAPNGVPEPATITLWALGALGIAATRRARTQNHLDKHDPRSARAA